MIKNLDAHHLEHFDQNIRGIDILGRRDAGPARMIMRQKNGMGIHQQRNRRDFPRIGGDLRNRPGGNLALADQAALRVNTDQMEAFQRLGGKQLAAIGLRSDRLAIRRDGRL